MGARDLLNSTGKCPYNCDNGRVYVPALGSHQSCPHCSELASQMIKEEVKVDGKSINDVLRVPDMYRNLTFSREIPEVSKLYEGNVLKNSATEVMECMEQVYGGILRGELPITSYYLWVGNGFDPLKFVYPCITQAFALGVSVTPFISTTELIQFYIAYEEGYGDGKRLEQELGVTYYDFCTSRICIISFEANAGAKSAVILADLLNARSRRGLPTIVVGYWSVEVLNKRKIHFDFLIGDGSRLSKLQPKCLQYGTKDVNDLYSSQKSVGVLQDVKEDIVARYAL